MIQVLDLFSGIGAFTLGLERAGGFRTVAFCEIDPFCRRVLARHWPDVRQYTDVQTLSADTLRSDGHDVDLICGGFPCQDISVAGKGAGLAGERSGLWRDFARLIGDVRPAYVIVENVSALLGRGLGTVLGDLAALGYDAEWHCIPASAVGAPHQRDRVWIVAYSHHTRCRDDGEMQSWGRQPSAGAGVDCSAGSGSSSPDMANADCGGWREQGHVGQAAGHAGAGQLGDSGAVLDNAISQRRDQGRQDHREHDRDQPSAACQYTRALSKPGSARLAIGPGTLGEWAHAATTGDGWWAVEPDVGRVVDGPAAKVDRRKRLIALGNGLVPQIPEILGRAILAREAAL